LEPGLFQFRLHLLFADVLEGVVRAEVRRDRSDGVGQTFVVFYDLQKFQVFVLNTDLCRDELFQKLLAELELVNQIPYFAFHIGFVLNRLEKSHLVPEYVVVRDKHRRFLKKLFGHLTFDSPSRRHHFSCKYLL
jgi:hypothetical protein